MTQVTTWWQEQTICHWHKVTQGFIEYRKQSTRQDTIGRICQTLLSPIFIGWGGTNKHGWWPSVLIGWWKKLHIYFPSPSHKHKRAIVVSSSEPRDTTYMTLLLKTLKDMILNYSRKRQGLSKKNILRINYFWHVHKWENYSMYKLLLAWHKKWENYSAYKLFFGMAQMRR